MSAMTRQVAAMTGSMNGNQNGGTNGTAATEKGCWTIGLINGKFKYLTAETFGCKINANGKSLKKKQVWILEPSGDGDTIVLRSHLNKYMSVDQFGNVTCDQEEKDERSKLKFLSVMIFPDVGLLNPSLEVISLELHRTL